MPEDPPKPAGSGPDTKGGVPPVISGWSTPKPANSDARRRLVKRAVGIVVGDAAIAALYFVGLVLMSNWEVIAIPSLFLMPLLGGLVASYVWRSLEPAVGAVVIDTLWMTVLALTVGAAVIGEGVICLWILFPLFYGIVLAGALIGRIIFKANRSRVHASILPVLALLALGEPLARVDEISVVTDEILIHAPPSRVWREVTSFPEIPTAPSFWLFSLGLPYPMATTSSGDFVGAERSCIFSGDAVFKEKVAELIPQQKLTFDITESPPDPELVGHLTPHRGQFVLRDNRDGTTTLVGSTWYTLHVRPLWYFDGWTRHIFRAVHRRVMEDIRRRAETSP